MDDKEKAIRNRLGIPMTADVTIVDLDEQQKPPEKITAGWTDSQIKGKTVEEIDSLIKQNQLALDSLENSVASMHQTIHGLRQVRQRKLIIGDS